VREAHRAAIRKIWLTEEGPGEIVITIPRGQLHALRIAPCVSEADLDRFDIYPPDKTGSVAVDSPLAAKTENGSARIMPLTLAGGATVFRVNRAAQNWRVEVVDEAKTLVKQMPREADIWNALMLARAKSTWNVGTPDGTPLDHPDGTPLDHPGGRLRSTMVVKNEAASLAPWLWAPTSA